MNSSSLFSSAVALDYASRVEGPRQAKKSHQMAYLEFLSAVIDRPVQEVLVKATMKSRTQKRACNL